MSKYEEARDKEAEKFCDDINHGVKSKYFWYSSGADWSRDYWEKENQRLRKALEKHICIRSRECPCVICAALEGKDE